jgi:hypothetical protein
MHQSQQHNPLTAVAVLTSPTAAAAAAMLAKVNDSSSSSSSNVGEGEGQQQQQVLPACLPPAGDQLADTIVLNEETILRAWSEYDRAGMRNADSSIAALLTQRE